MPFTVDGSEALELRIQADMARIRDEALAAVGAENLTALALGGGYGRGEGGVYVVDGEERIYNDYDLFVIVPFRSRSRRKWVSERLRAAKERAEPSCGIHVDFSPPMPLSQLPVQPYELMFMEARAGYHVIYGPAGVLDALPAYDAGRPPLEECARLFMNRGVGLLLAARLLDEKGESPDREDHEFIVRNIYKALMAMGDSVLFVEGRYSPSYLQRRERFRASRLDGVPDPVGLRDRYESALEFKLRPVHDVPGGVRLGEWLSVTVEAYLDMFLWFERIRLNRPAMDWADYAALPARLPALPVAGRVKCLARNMRHAKGGLPPVDEWFLHPRDRILKRLPGLLRQDGQWNAGEVLALWSMVG